MSNKPAQIDLDQVQRNLIESINDHTGYETRVSGIHLKCTKTALAHMYSYLLKVDKDIMRIASGIATIKGNDSITMAEMIQAIKMKEEGVEYFLPTEVEDQ